MKTNTSNTKLTGRGNGISYTSYADGNVIRADLDNTMFDAMDVEEKIFRGVNPKTFFISTFWNDDNGFKIKTDMIMNDRYSGRAKCNTADGDKKNDSIGMELARGRCLEKYHRAFDKRILMLLEDARTLVASVERYCERANLNIENVESIEDIKARRFSCGK